LSTTLTPNANLQKPATADRYWDVPMNANTDALDRMGAIGALCVSTFELPSATLNVKLSAGSLRTSNGARIAVAAVPSLTLAASTTTYLYLDDTGTLQQNTTGWPSANVAPLAVVTTGATAVTGLTDARGALFTYGLPVTGYATTSYVDAGDATNAAAISANATAIAAKVSKAGDTMTGFLTLSAAPTAPMHAVNKGYVDALSSPSLVVVKIAATQSATGVYGADTAGNVADVVVCDATLLYCDVSFPQVANYRRVFRVSDISATGSSYGTRLHPEHTGGTPPLIDGGTTYPSLSPGSRSAFVTDGVNWFTVT
jgi:hypothetical protein